MSAQSNSDRQSALNVVEIVARGMSADEAEVMGKQKWFHVGLVDTVIVNTVKKLHSYLYAVFLKSSC